MGDQFLAEIFSTLQDMQKHAIDNKSAQPYVYQYYNIVAYHKKLTSGTTTVIARILNSFVKGLNNRPRLPRFVVIPTDKDIIEDVNLFDFGAAREITANVDWLLRQINIFIHQRKTELSEIKPGAVYSTDPKVVLVTMLCRPLIFPSNSRMERVLSLRPKFNNAINNAAYEAGHSVMQIDSCNTITHFDLMGHLSHLGQFTFWKDVNYQLEKYDRSKEGLEPRSDQGKPYYNRKHCTCSSDRNRRN